jgi:hypothetical protein
LVLADDEGFLAAFVMAGQGPVGEAALGWLVDDVDDAAGRADADGAQVLGEHQHAARCGGSGRCGDVKAGPGVHLPAGQGVRGSGECLGPEPITTVRRRWW